MGKNKNKSKRKSKEGSPSPSATKELSEADAAAGMMMVVKPDAEAPAIKSENNKSTTKKDKQSMVDGNDEDAPKNHNSKRARDNNNTDNAAGSDDNENSHNAASQKTLTRKQKRQKLNEKNQWPQHPKIGNPAQRAKAYLRVAGIEAMEDEDAAEFALVHNKDKQKKNNGGQKNSDSSPDDDGEEWRRFGRFLGGTDARTRHRAVKKLGQYLKAKAGAGLPRQDEEVWKDISGLSELDWMKLWKGLWYTLYMADKVPVQDELAKHLAKLIWCVAGTLEEDEVAGQHYMLLDQEQEEAEERARAEGSEEGDSDDEEVKILSSRFVEMEDDENEEDKSSDSDSDDKAKVSDSSDDNSNDGDEDMNDGQLHNHQYDHEEEDDDPSNDTHTRGAPLASLMIRTFFRTLVREWGMMDKYRIDKFYTLVRYILREVYRYMATRQWNVGIIKLFNDAITEEALVEPPNGVRYHLIDIALEELSDVVSKTGGETLPMTEAIYLEVMEPFFVMAQHGFGDKTVQARVVEKVFEKFLLEYSVVSDKQDGDDSDEEEVNTDSQPKIFDQIHVGTVSRYIFELAGAEGTMDGHRKSLYEMYKTYERQIRKMGTDIDIESALGLGEQGEEDEDDEDYSESMEFGGDVDDEEEEEADDFIQAMGFLNESEDDENVEDAESDKDFTPTKQSKKKDKKEKSQKDTANEAIKSNKGKRKKKDSMDVTQHRDEDGKKKHKKKKKEHAKRSDDSDEEDVVTISLKDQKQAKEAFKELEKPTHDGDSGDDKPKSSKKLKKKKRKSEEGDGNKEDSGSRRVSFGEKNRARSWKASMKGLRDLNPKETISKTPEKSILHKKPKHSPNHIGTPNQRNRSGTPKHRKRAVDYF